MDARSSRLSVPRWFALVLLVPLPAASAAAALAPTYCSTASPNRVMTPVALR